MKISLNWLKTYIKTDLPAEEIARILTGIGLEVEALEKIESIRGGLAGLVVGEVLTCEKHPDADKLHVTTVDLGDGVPTQIVCGAPNVAAGQKVVVATINTTLYPTGEENGFKIKKSKIRGVESFGMLCAEDEIGVGTDHQGIIVLPNDVKAGTPARDYFQLEDDYLMEIGLTPNRADAMSHYGVARDLAVYLKANDIPYEFGLPSVDAFRQDNDSKHIEVEVANSEAAPRYMGLTMTGIKIAPSPEWLQRRLIAIGMNPKNNVVDITNFILHETGQPLHAFDASKITGNKIVVRTCPEGTEFVTLDGVSRKLSAQDLMICNAEKPMCIAGVFGGLDSGVTDSTTEVFIESAYFNPVWIRKTAKRHGLSTDASFRYERGIDPNMTPYALKRAALLIQELAGGKVTSPITDLYPVRIEPFRFEVSFDRIKKLIGKNIPDETIRKIILALDVKIESEDDGVLNVCVPPYRVDVQREADLIEDILRIYGYDNVEIPEHVNSSLSYAPRPNRDKIANTLSDLLASIGFREIMSNSQTKAAYYEGLTSYPASRCVKILNPLSNDLNVMRQTLLFNALEAVQLNTNRKNGDLKLFELGNCYSYDATKAEQGGLAPYEERAMVSMIVTGNDRAASWNVPSRPSDFFTLKSAAERMLKRFGLDLNSAVFETCDSDLYSEAVCCKFNGSQRLLEMGVVSRKIRNQFDIKNDVFYLEMNFDTLVKLIRNHSVTVSELSKFPEVKRDLALLVDKAVTFSQLRHIAYSTEKKLLKNVTLFDVYEGDKLPEGKKSYALSFTLEDTTKTLTDQVIDRTMNNLLQAFEKQTGAQLRG